MSKSTFFQINKLKTENQLIACENHNMRLESDENADPGKIQTLIPITSKDDGAKMTYMDAFNKRISGLACYQNGKLHRDQIRGLDVTMTLSCEKTTNIDIWVLQSMAWLHDTFEVAPDNKTNIINAELHADEPGNIHIHAFLIPIDEHGHLNASRFMKQEARIAMQTSYDKYVADLDQATELPPTVSGETIEEYRARLADDWKRLIAANCIKAEVKKNPQPLGLDQFIREQHRAGQKQKDRR